MGQGFIRAREFSINFHAPQLLSTGGGGQRESIGDYLRGLDQGYGAGRGCCCGNGGWFGGWRSFGLGLFSGVMGMLGGWFGGMNNWFSSWGNLNFGYGSGWGFDNFGGGSWFGNNAKAGDTNTTPTLGKPDLTRTNRTSGSDNTPVDDKKKKETPEKVGDKDNVDTGDTGGNTTITGDTDTSRWSKNDIEKIAADDLKKLTSDQIKKLTKDAIQALKPAQLDALINGNLTSDEAKALLKTLGLINETTDNDASNISMDYVSLKLMEKAGIAAKVAKNIKQNAGITDPYITGNISNVEVVGGKLKYTVDCKGVGKIGLTYTFQAIDPNNTQFKIIKIVNNTDNNVKIDDNWKDRVYTSANKAMLEIDANALVSTRSHANTALDKNKKLEQTL